MLNVWKNGGRTRRGDRARHGRGSPARKRSPHLPVGLGALGQLYLTRFEMNGAPSDLLTAHHAYARALRRADSAAPRTAILLSSKGTIEVTLASLDVTGSGVDAAVSDLAAAVTAGARNPRLRAFLLANLAAGLAARHRTRHRQEDLEAGVGAYEQACEAALTYDLEVALNAALGWGDWASTRASWAEASRAYDLAFEAADRLGSISWAAPRRRSGSAPPGGWESRPGGRPARAGELERAAAFLERGRARLLAESLGLAQLDLGLLAEVDPDFAGRYVAAADRLRGLDAITREQRSSFQPPLARTKSG